MLGAVVPLLAVLYTVEVVFPGGGAGAAPYLATAAASGIAVAALMVVFPTCCMEILRLVWALTLAWIAVITLPLLSPGPPILDPPRIMGLVIGYGIVAFGLFLALSRYGLPMSLHWPWSLTWRKRIWIDAPRQRVFDAVVVREGGRRADRKVLKVERIADDPPTYRQTHRFFGYDLEARAMVPKPFDYELVEVETIPGKLQTCAGRAEPNMVSVSTVHLTDHAGGTLVDYVDAATRMPLRALAMFVLMDYLGDFLQHWKERIEESPPISIRAVDEQMFVLYGLAKTIGKT